MKYLRLFPAFLFLLIFSSAFPSEGLKDKLTKKWALDGFSDSISLSLLQKSSFELVEGGKSTTGEWLVEDKALVLIFGHPSEAANIDSMKFRVLVDKPVLKYYAEGKEILVQEEGQWLPAREKRVFEIIKLDGPTLFLKEGERVYKFSGLSLIVYEGKFNLDGLLRGLLGLFSLLLLAYVLSGDKKNINWPLVGKGVLLQVVFAILVLKIPFVQTVFEGISNIFVGILNFTRAGSTFVFGGLVKDVESFGFIFAFQVLPTIIFFSALTSLLYYLGIIQKIVFAFAWAMNRLMGLSGAESLAAAGNIFLGQTEAPLLIKPYIERMTKSEILCLMGGGMATIAGGVLAAYIGFLGGNDPQQQLFFAKHLIIASVLSAPAAIVASKILLPETEEFDRKLEVSREKIGDNVLESISNGTVQGLKLAVNVGAMLVVFIAFIAMANFFFTDIIGHYTGINEWVASYSNGQYKGLSLQFILGFILKPLAWLMGTNWADSALVGQLLGEKTILNEFVAYVTLGDLKDAGQFTDEKSIIIATYILCGFSNFSSIGIQIGGIGVLAPNRRTLLSQLGIKALIAGTLASLFTAVIIGMLI